MRISIAKIRQNASLRPAGYVDDVLSAGAIEGEWLVISPESYKSLCKRYAPASNLAQAGACCGKKPVPFPSIPQQLKSVSKAGLRAGAAILKGERLRRSKEEIERIKAICQSQSDCFDPQTERCRKCGCKLGLPLIGKWTWETEKCPKALW